MIFRNHQLAMGLNNQRVAAWRARHDAMAPGTPGRAFPTQQIPASVLARYRARQDQFANRMNLFDKPLRQQMFTNLAQQRAAARRARLIRRYGNVYA